MNFTELLNNLAEHINMCVGYLESITDSLSYSQ